MSSPDWETGGKRERGNAESGGETLLGKMTTFNIALADIQTTTAY
jgi:hypothetical protein